MKDNKEVRQLNPEEEKDISGGMKINSKILPNINTTMVAYGAPIIRPQLMKYGGPVIKPILPAVKPDAVPNPTIAKSEELVPSNFENEKPKDK